ncbi:MAG: DUF2207 domain-containing protein [Desulfovibrio sp.]|nr:DUF2207 domain-containing protein [Desulfovibrio sp.]
MNVHKEKGFAFLGLPVFAGGLLFIFVFMSQCCHARECIDSFSAEVRVQTDASLLVKESISVTAEQDTVRHGIFRSIPTLTWHARHLGIGHVELLEARMDNTPVQVRREDSDLQTTFVLGNSETELEKGTHVFEITYRATGHLRREKNGYAIHYNVTGKQWNLPIDQAELLLILPDGSRVTDFSSCISKGAQKTDEGTVGDGHLFVTERPLGKGEALVIHVRWEGGGITLPAQSLRERMGAYGPQIMQGTALIPLFFFVLFWFLFRRGRKLPVVPLYSPPEGISPGLAAYISGKPELAFHADLLWTAVSGFMRMEKGENNWTFVPAWPKRVRQNWQNEACLGIANRLFSEHGEIVRDLRQGMPDDWRPVRSDDGERLYHAFGNLESGYRQKMKSMAPRSALLPLSGALVNVLLLYAAFYFSGWIGIYDGQGLLDHFIGIVFFGFLSALPILICMKKGIVRRIALCLSCSCSVLILGILTEYDPLFFSAALTSVFAPLFFWLCFPVRPTSEGLKARAAVEGLALYISRAGTERSDRLSDHDDTPERYGEMLPYALAIGKAKAWEKRFEMICAQTGSCKDWQDPYMENPLYVFVATDPSYSSALAAASAAGVAYGASQRASGDGDSGGSDSDGGSTGGGGGGGW